uniref:COesterase domain-containing protein n=1 Tax=Parastrongyloides trichosuri TaxID=131310 RepID=A0A0N4ZJT0_PARTI
MTSPEHIWPDWMKSTHGDELYYAFGWPIKDFIENNNGKIDGQYKQEKRTSLKVMYMIKNFTNIQGFYRNWEKFTDTYRRGVLVNSDFDPRNITTIVTDMETDECRALLPYLPEYLPLIEIDGKYTNLSENTESTSKTK